MKGVYSIYKTIYATVDYSLNGGENMNNTTISALKGEEMSLGMMGEVFKMYSEERTNGCKDVTIYDSERILNNISKLENEYLRRLFDLSGVLDFVQELDRIVSCVNADSSSEIFRKMFTRRRINQQLLNLFEEYRHRYIFLDKDRKYLCSDLENWVKISNERCEYLQRIDEEHRNLKDLCDRLDERARVLLKNCLDDINSMTMHMGLIENTEILVEPEIFETFYKMLKEDNTWEAVRGIKMYVKSYQKALKTLGFN